MIPCVYVMEPVCLAFGHLFRKEKTHFNLQIRPRLQYVRRVSLLAKSK